jgi:hypothetical protein
VEKVKTLVRTDLGIRMTVDKLNMEKRKSETNFNKFEEKIVCAKCSHRMSENTTSVSRKKIQ